MPDTIQLGLVVRGKVRARTDIDQEPHPGTPDLFGRTTYSEYGGHITWTTEVRPKPFDATVLLNTLRLTTVSIRQRAIFYGTYCLSKFTLIPLTLHLSHSHLSSLTASHTRQMLLLL